MKIKQKELFLKKYITNTSGLQVFQLIRFGALILISIVFTKTKLTTSDIGSYEIFLFISGLMCSFWINGLIQSFLPLFRESTSLGEENSGKSAALFNVFILISLFSVLAAMILVVFRNQIESAFNHSADIRYFNMLLLYIFFSSPAFLIEYIYLLNNKPGSIIKYGITTFLLQFIVISSVAVLNYGMYYCIAGLIGITLLRYVWLLILIRKYAVLSFSLAFIREHLHVGFPLIASSLLGSSAQYIDGFLVVNKFDTATFAIFQYGAREFPLVLLMANAFSTSMIPEFTESGNLGSALKELRIKSTKLMHLLFPVTLALLLTSHWLYPRIFNPNFTDSATIFNIYLLLIVSRLVFPHSILIGLKKTRCIMTASIAELAVNFTFSIIFIQLWGISGVAFGTVIAYTFQKLLWIFNVKKLLGIGPAKYIPLRWLCTYTVLLIIVFLFVI